MSGFSHSNAFLPSDVHVNNLDVQWHNLYQIRKMLYM